MSSSRAYGGQTAEERRTQRRTALVAAALEIVGTSGHARLTVSGLCVQAGLNERYFYESFGGLDDVLLAVLDEVVADVSTAIVIAVAAAAHDAPAKAEAAIRAAVEVLTDDPRKSRVMFVEPLSAPALAARRGAVARTFVALILDQAEGFYGPGTSERVGAAGSFAASYLLGGLAETLTAWLRGDLEVDRDELIERSTDLFVAVADHVIGPIGELTDHRQAASDGRPRTDDERHG